MSTDPQPVLEETKPRYGFRPPDKIEPYDGPVPPWKWPGILKGPFRNNKRGLGSSDAAVITGESKWKSPLALYLEIRGEIAKAPTKFPDVAMVGLMMESLIAELYRNKTKRLLVDRATYEGWGSRWDVRAHPEYPWLLANLDMESELVPGCEPLPFEASGPGVNEYKSKDAWGEYFDERGNPTREVLVQIQHQLLVTGFEWATACFLVGRKFYMVDVKAHEGYQEWLLGELAHFWERCWNGDPPEPDSSESTHEAIVAKFPMEKKGRVVTLSERASAMIPRYNELKRFSKEAKDESDEIRNHIEWEMGDSEEAIDLWRTQGFSFKASKPGADYYRVDAPIESHEEAQLAAMGAKLVKGKKSSRTLRPKKADNVGR